MNDVQDEIERLKRQVEQLQKALGERRSVSEASESGSRVCSAPNLPSLRDNYEFVTDMTRYAEGLLLEKDVRKKHHFDEATWEALGNDDALVEKIELEKTRRIRSGETKKELAQKHIIRGPAVLAGIMDDERANPRHRVDSIRALDALAAPESRFAEQRDEVRVIINLGNDEKIVIGGPVKPTPATNIIDATPTPTRSLPNNHTDDPPPVRRGPGRPRGSKNRPKPTDAEAQLPFDAAKQTDGEGSGEPL
jgi:hypothetical protein